MYILSLAKGTLDGNHDGAGLAVLFLRIYFVSHSATPEYYFYICTRTVYYFPLAGAITLELLG